MPMMTDGKSVTLGRGKAALVLLPQVIAKHMVVAQFWPRQAVNICGKLKTLIICWINVGTGLILPDVRVCSINHAIVLPSYPTCHRGHGRQ